MISFDLRARYPGFRLEASAAWDVPAAALLGASGSGKTTILEALAGLRPEVGGRFGIGGEEIEGLPAARRRVGWVPQDASLFPHLTARGNVEFAGRSHASDAAIDALELAPLLDRRAPQLSGGERQRVAIARALAARPRLLLLDEPLASVDRPLRARIVPFLARIPRDLGVPTLLVTHDPHEAVALAQHAVVLDRGRVAAQGDPRGILASPAALGVLEALGAENLFEVRAVAQSPGVVSLETPRGGRLEMAAVAGFPAPSRVAVRAEDILLAGAEPGPVSAQNVIPGEVASLENLGDHVYVRLSTAADSWVAKVTARAVTKLGLAPGRRAWMLVKAHAVHAFGDTP
ncbi:MAG: ATP-binding cassette domain-containing protein [Planctomycetia bacterium]|nr:ATP-binding cassette domain-containing protein [Planctomycetia bacterium]